MRNWSRTPIDPQTFDSDAFAGFPPGEFRKFIEYQESKMAAREARIQESIQNARKNFIDNPTNSDKLTSHMNTSPTSLSYIISGSGAISGVADGKPFSIQPDFPSYKAVVEAIKAKDGVTVSKLVNVAATIKTYSKGVCEVINGEVVYNNAPLANVLTKRIITLMKEGFTIDPMLRFLENLMMNPSKAAISELYLFLEAAALPITEDGCFLAYKRVGGDFKSKHASPDGTYLDHRLGEKPSMPREDVDPDRNNTCSQGLHFCSLSYLPHYGSDSSGEKTVIVKINPADVVAIPSDYSNAKGRAWTYEVVGVHTGGENVEAFSEPVYSTDAATYGTKPSGQRFWSVRDEHGKFVKRG